MTGKAKGTVLPVRLPRELDRALPREAKRSDRTKAAVVRIAIGAYLKRVNRGES